ncbi:TetR/AcrR family transcriptional regulator [Smaragdicoccus niigatensis]
MLAVVSTTMTRAALGRTYAGQAIADRQKERRARFLESALTIFAQDGYSNSSVGAICRAAGLSSRQFYEEFSGREDVLVELFQNIEAESMAAVADAVAQAGGRGIEAVIQAATRAYIQSVASDPRRARVGLVEVVGASPRVEEVRLDQRKVWAQMVLGIAQHAAESGEIPSGDYAIRVSAVIGAINYVVYDWSVADPKPDIETVISVLSRSLIGAMAS